MILCQYASGCLIREPEFAKDEISVTVKTPDGFAVRYNRDQLMRQMKRSSSTHTWVVALAPGSLQSTLPTAPSSAPAPRALPDAPDASVTR